MIYLLITHKIENSKILIFSKIRKLKFFKNYPINICKTENSIGKQQRKISEFS